MARNPIQSLSRRTPMRRWVVFMLLPVLLFAQFATAAYACPLLTRAMAQSASMPIDCDMSKADTDQPTLCQAHCTAAAQSSGPTLDLAAMPALPTPHPVWHAPVRTLATHPAAAHNAAPYSGPPLYLLHMVLRD
ncbi:MAG: hypothetical protein KIT60_20370 [Burkholderiaceae bacterium]|nr:hypothetical protein [Burkholderiaceae bacterium]